MKPYVKIARAGLGVTPMLQCAKCGMMLPSDYREDHLVVLWNFCPMCGEKIDKYYEKEKSK